MCEDLKEPIVFKTAEIRVKVESCLNDLEFSDILQTCEFLGYLDGIHEAGGINLNRQLAFKMQEFFMLLTWTKFQLKAINAEFVF